MKLYDHPLSPYAMKIRMILLEKGIAYESHEIHTHAQRDELLRLNPRAEVPALVDGEAVLFDSKLIAEYLEETHPEPALIPKDPAGKAACRAIELHADTTLDAAVIAFSLFKFFRTGMAETHPDALRASEEIVRGHFRDLEARLAGREYFLGEFSRADIAVAPHLGACRFMGLVPGDDTPALAAWLVRVTERESMKRVTEQAIAAIGKEPEDPFFDTNRLHWRSDRIEALLRVGLGPWLLDELASDRGFLPPTV